MTTTAKVKPGCEDKTSPADLPEGWATATLGDIVSKLVDGSHNPPPKQAKGRPMLSARNIGDGSFLLNEGYRLISEKDFKVEHARTQAAPGDVLLTIVGSIGRSLVVPEDTEAFAFQRSVAVARPILLDPTFLAYNFRAPGSQSFFEENGAGTAQMGVYLGTLSDMPLPLAPIAEQRRIVAKIEELLGHVNASCHRLAKAYLTLKRFRQAVLAAACSGRLTEDWRASIVKNANIVKADGRGQDNELEEDLPSGWRIVSVSEITDVLGGKRTPKGTKYSDGVTAHPYIRVVDFDDMTISSGNLKYISDKTFESIRKYTISANDVYISIAGSIGKVGLVPQHLDGASLTENAAKLTNLREIAKEFLVYALNARSAQEQIEEFVTSSGQPKLALFRIEKIALLLPPAEEQQVIVRRVEALFKLTDAIEKRVEAATKRADKLTQAILAKAFRGELVPTEAELARREGRPYETASALLERIRREREAKSGDKIKVNPRRKRRKISPQA